MIVHLFLSLVCAVSYASLTGEKMYFRKFFKFQVIMTIRFMLFHFPPGGEGYSLELLVGVCLRHLQIQTQFQTKKCHLDFGYHKGKTCAPCCWLCLITFNCIYTIENRTFMLLFHENPTSHVFHQYPQSSFYFPEKSNFLQKLINARCRLALSIFEFTCVLRLLQKRNSFLYLIVTKEHDMSSCLRVHCLW